MQLDFHYYATYCAAYLAGYSHDESVEICYSAQFPDNCTRTFLAGIKAPVSAATTQTALEMAEADTSPVGLQNITRIWASFHFLPYDLYANVKKGGKRYKNKYRLICNPNGALLKDTVELAKGKSLQAVGMAMHILADTWAHRYFAGTPSVVINDTNHYFYEVLEDAGEWSERALRFKHTPGDKIETASYINSVSSSSEASVMNLGHGRAGHLPDYSFLRYKFMPSWNDYAFIYKDNPEDYYHAFCQMIYAMKYLRGDVDSFETGRYDTEAAKPHKEKIQAILTKRQTDASADWKAFGETLSGSEIPDFDVALFRSEYERASAEEKDATALGRFIIAALAQKSMITNRIYRSGNLLAGYSAEYDGRKIGIRDFFKLLKPLSFDGVEDEGGAK